MHKKKKKTALGAVFAYLLTAVGSWMFLNSYANSYNRLTQDKIAPASLVMNGDTAKVEILEYSAQFSTKLISPDSRLYCIAYLISPDELRTAAYLTFFLP